MYHEEKLIRTSFAGKMKSIYFQFPIHIVFFFCFFFSFLFNQLGTVVESTLRLEFDVPFSFNHPLRCFLGDQHHPRSPSCVPYPLTCSLCEISFLCRDTIGDVVSLSMSESKMTLRCYQ